MEQEENMVLGCQMELTKVKTKIEQESLRRTKSSPWSARTRSRPQNLLKKNLYSGSPTRILLPKFSNWRYTRGRLTGFSILSAVKLL